MKTHWVFWGNWGPVYPEMNMDLSVDLDVPSTSKLMALANLSDVELGQLNLEFDLSALDNRFSINRIITTLDGELAVASIEGSLDDVINMQGFDLDVTANVSFLNQLLNQLGIEVPAVLPPDVGVSAHISGQLDPLEIKNIRTEVRDEGLEILVSGSVGNALALSGVDGQFVLRADSTSTFSKYAGLDLPDLGVVEVSGDVLSAEDLLRLESVNARISSPNVNLAVTGAVDDIIGMVGIDLTATGDIDSFTDKNITELETLFEQLQLNVPLEFLPERVNIEANASGSLEQLAVSDIQGNISDSGVEINLSGAIDNAIAVEGGQRYRESYQRGHRRFLPLCGHRST